MKRLGILYPPCGAEFEYYHYGEALADDTRVSLMGVRIYGDDEEHAPEHLSRTGELDNLSLSARVMKRVAPDAAIWACTSGSFVDGLAHARRQTQAVSEILGCPVTSTSLAFLDALKALDCGQVAILSSYPEATASRFFVFLSEAGVQTIEYRCLDIDSGPAAATLELDQVSSACRDMSIPEEAALLIPDTAIPTMHWIENLEQDLGRGVLTANQVSLWQTARLAEIDITQPLPGRLGRI